MSLGRSCRPCGDQCGGGLARWQEVETTKAVEAARLLKLGKLGRSIKAEVVRGAKDTIHRYNISSGREVVVVRFGIVR